MRVHVTSGLQYAYPENSSRRLSTFQTNSCISSRRLTLEDSSTVLDYNYDIVTILSQPT